MAKLQILKPRIATAPMGGVRVVASVSWRSEKKSSTARGYGYRWQKERERYLAEHPLCVYCEREGHITAATVVDHKIPHRGDDQLFWDESNWQSLCAVHHNKDKQCEEARQG